MRTAALLAAIGLSSCAYHKYVFDETANTIKGDDITQVSVMDESYVSVREYTKQGTEPCTEFHILSDNTKFKCTGGCASSFETNAIYLFVIRPSGDRVNAPLRLKYSPEGKFVRP
jgi:hypothetical protein